MAVIERGSDLSKIEKKREEIAGNIDKIIRNEQERSPNIENFLLQAINFNPENGEILDIARIQWLENRKAQVVIDAKKAVNNLLGIADDVGLKGVLRGAREFCSSNIKSFGMEGMFDENAIICDIEDI